MIRPTRLGRWLRAVRALRGHTQEDAALMCGTHSATLRAWEAGGLPSLTGLLAIRHYAAGVQGIEPATLDDLAEWARQPVDEEVTP